MYVEIWVFSFESFEKLCAVILLRFQWKLDRVLSFDLFGPGFSFYGNAEEEKYTSKPTQKKRNSQNKENIRSSIQK